MNEDKNEIEEFNSWNELKIKLNKLVGEVFFRERDIYWANFGKNIGNEQNGKNENFSRPVLIITKFNEDNFWGLPISTQEKREKYYYIFEKNNRKYSINLSQIRLFSSKRLFRKTGKLNEKDFKEVKNLLSGILQNPLKERGFGTSKKEVAGE